MYALNTGSVNSSPVNGVGTISILASGSGLILSVEQVVGKIGGGLILSLEQDTRLYEVGGGLIISIEQVGKLSGVGRIITFEQNVMQLADNRFYQRNGYDVEIVIGGLSIPKNQIHGNVRISRTTGESGTASFTIIPPAGVQTPESYQGKPVYINIIKDGESFRQFTGWVDLPSIDIIDRKISFDCSDRRINRINELPKNVIEQVGSYSKYVHGEITDNNDELQKRLQCVSGDFDFTKEGNYLLTPWAPKATADFILSGSDVYYDKPDVSYTSRTQTVNTIEFTVNYSYQRLHQQAVTMVWNGYDTLPSWHAQGLPSFPAKEMIENAARTGAWQPITSPNLVDLWPAQGYNSVDGVVVWQPNQIEHEYVARTRKVGVLNGAGQIIDVETPVYDVNNKKIYDVVKTTTTDTSSHLCRGASWRAGLKFAQNVTESYTITLKNNTSRAKFGVIKEKDQVEIVDEYDVSRWEDASTGVYNVDYNFFQNQKTNYIELSRVMQVMLNKSRVELLKAHRDVVVSFRREIWPQIDLQHTVEIASDVLQCKGKVDSISHDIDASTGEASTSVQLKLSRSNGSDVTDTFAIIMPPLEDAGYVGVPYSIYLQTHVGINPDPTVTTGADKWNGFIGNANKSETVGNNFTTFRTQFVEEFRVDYPEISDTLRSVRTLTSDATFNVAIPNDPLTIEW